MNLANGRREAVLRDVQRSIGVRENVTGNGNESGTPVIAALAFRPGHARGDRGISRRRNGLRSFSEYPPSARPARCSKTFLAPESPVSTQDTAAAIPYSGSMARPPQHAY
jgi:hypothetical protein